MNRQSSPSESTDTLNDSFGLHTAIRFVEFVGLPGAGKTTAANILALELSRHGWHVRTNTHLPDPKLSFLRRQLSRLWVVVSQAGNPQFTRICLLTLRLVVQSRQESLEDAVRVTWNLWTVSAAIIRQRASAGSISILDQALLQGIWSVMLTSRRKPSTQAWMQLLSAVGMKDFAFVFLDAGPCVARERLFARRDTASRMKRESKRFGEARWSAAAQMISRIESELRNNTGVEVSKLLTVTVTGSATPDELVAQILHGLI